MRTVFLPVRTSTSALLPLKNMKFVLSGKMDKEKYQGKIEALGGSVANTVTKEVIALISDKGKKNISSCKVNINSKYIWSVRSSLCPVKG